MAVQISANGKTTSLGDHDTEEEAARAFDRAAINKDGSRARTNFPVDQYETEVDDLQSKIAGQSKASSHTSMRFDYPHLVLYILPKSACQAAHPATWFRMRVHMNREHHVGPIEGVQEGQRPTTSQTLRSHVPAATWA